MPRRSTPPTDLARLARAEPDAARDSILSAIRAARGDHAAAALALGETPRGLYALITGLFLWEAVDELHRAHRWPMVTGRPG